MKKLDGDVDDEEAGDTRKKKKKEKKKLNLLSFGEEAGEEEEELAKMAKPKVKSVFDADAAENDGRIAKPGSAEEAAALDKDAEELERTKAFRERMRAKLAAREAGLEEPDDGDGGLGDFERRMREKAAAKNAQFGEVAARVAAEAADAEEREAKRRRKEEKAAEKERRAEEKREKEANRLRKLGIGKAKLTSEEAELMTASEVRRVETKHKRKNVAGREKGMLAKLKAFESNLKEAAAKSGPMTPWRRTGSAASPGRGKAPRVSHVSSQRAYTTARTTTRTIPIGRATR